MSLKRNTIWNLLGMGLPLIGAAAFIPYCLRQLGDESFGVLTLVWALIGYFSLFDFGAGRALTYELAKLRASENFSSIPMVLRAGLLLTAMTGLIGAIIMLIAAPFLAHHWLNISPALQQDALHAFQIAALGVIPTSVTSGVRGALEGMERFAASNLNKVVLGFCMFCLPAFSIAVHGNQLWWIALYLVLARLSVVLFSIWQLRKHLISTDKFATGEPSKFTPVVPISTYMRRLVSYGAWVTVSGIISPLMVYGDRFFVSAVVGADKLSAYAIPQEGLMRLLIVPIALCGALLPAFATTIDVGTLWKSYRNNLKRMIWIMAALCIVVCLGAYPFFSLWISPSFADKAFPIALILAVGTFFNAIALVPQTLLHAKGQTKITAQFHLFEAMIYIAALYLLSKEFGLIGAAIAWVLRVSIDLVLLHMATQRLFKEMKVVST
jgi:O-antigen/teichoic acid export membrane protein